MDVRWLEVLDDDGQGLRFEAEEKPFACSVLPYSEYELENALHREELPQVNYTWVRLMAAQKGVGGDDSWVELRFMSRIFWIRRRRAVSRLLFVRSAENETIRNDLV